MGEARPDLGSLDTSVDHLSASQGPTPAAVLALACFFLQEQIINWTIAYSVSWDAGSDCVCLCVPAPGTMPVQSSL